MNSSTGGIGFKIWGADDVVYGPVELPTLIEWVRDERVEADTWVFSEKTDNWARAKDVPDLDIIFRRRAGMAVRKTGGEEVTPLVEGIKPGMLRRVKILSEMPEQQLGRFVNFMEVLRVRQFQDIVKQGDRGDSMFLVLEGEVRVRLMIAGKETTLATLNAGDFFGDISLFDQGPRSADVVANNDCVLLKIATDNFHALTREAPEVAAPFLMGICRTLTSRMRADNKRYRDTINFARASAPR